MAVLNLGTYPPKQCGIATFSLDLRNSLALHGNEVQVMTVSDNSNEYQYPAEVVINIRQQQKRDYMRAATRINASSSIELVIIQHEYGIFGGRDGEYILEFTRLLRKPYIVITHTVLPDPEKHQKLILNKLLRTAAGIICMTEQSARLLIDLYGVIPELIHIIGHGVPEFTRRPAGELKRQYGLEGKQIISTFGLIGPGKGLELGIRAIANIIADFPDAYYLILGQTHPMLKQSEGETYRDMLVELVEELGLEQNVQFVNKYLTDQELGDYLYLTDIYLSPYPNKDQAVSGTMAFALGCGRAIVSTSYAYAAEVLKNGRGLLAPDPDPAQLAALMKQVLSDSQLKAHLQDKAYELGKTWSWPSIGKQYENVFRQILAHESGGEVEKVKYAGL